MCVIAIPEDIKKKLEIIYQYEIGPNVFREDTPDYVLKLNEEVNEFYKKETTGTM